MSRSRPFSVYLLKPGIEPSAALREGHRLSVVEVPGSPPGWEYHLLQGSPSQPWWAEYFGIDERLNQQSQGALIFVPTKERCFAFSFGHARYELDEDAYEYDFGLRVTLNCVDPKKLKNTDTVEPSTARRQRTQVSVDSDITLFDFDRDSAVLRSLTGKIKDEYKDVIGQATGASSLRITTRVSAEDLPGLCDDLLKLYSADSFKTSFPGIQSVSPVGDPAVIGALNEKLGAAARSREGGNLSLSVPDLVNYNNDVYVDFVGAGRCQVTYEDVFIVHYFDYLAEKGLARECLTIPDLKRHHLRLTTGDSGGGEETFSIFKSLIFDTMLDGDSATYHLTEGHWYRVDHDYVEKLQQYLDKFWVELDLPECTHHLEGDYNLAVAKDVDGYICLDRKNISPSGQTQIEPCDLYDVHDGRARLTHVKISTHSSTLSHLFSQGTNSVDAMKSEPESAAKLIALIVGAAGDSATTEGIAAPVRSLDFEVRFAIITHRDATGKSKNLPLFSRITLRRALKDLQVRAIPASFGFVHDAAEDRRPKPKNRKRKTKTS